MHLAFVDIEYGYTADRPDADASLGGTTSAVCFLARELTRQGVACTLFNKIEQPAEVLGIKSLPLEALIDERANPAYSAFIFCGRWVEWLVKLVRESTDVPLIAWMHESSFNDAMVPALDQFTGAVFVSEWQQRINQTHILPKWKQAVIRNGMNPRFAALFPPGTPIIPAKTRPPILLYAGATPRGAFHIPPLLDRLRPRRKDFSMEIFCNASPTRDPQANETYINWMWGLPNVAHVGMVSQTELAKRMQRAAFLVSPNPWPETSCIALIEALAAGLTVITTDRAVLPETAAGFAQHIAIEDRDHPVRFDMPMPLDAFAEAVDRAMTDWLAEPQKAESRLRTQIDHFNAHYQWAQRVAPWTEFIRACA
jgi:glycosyltransferase involved in cell wall biosynthesis